MSGGAREEILDRIRGALAAAPMRSQHGTPSPVRRDYARSRGDGDLLERFVERVADYNATVERVPPEGLPAAIARACAGYRAASVAVPADTPQEWLSDLAGVRVVRDAGLAAEDLDRVDAVLTGAAVGIAETGTIVLDSGPRQGRRALSLVPDVHVCIVEAAQVVDDVPAALERLRPERPITWISGPSATSDIELDRVEGVHGPRTLHVLVVVPAAAPAAPDQPYGGP
jgi:L-lactate dehydrogenase complex protein LldG